MATSIISQYNYATHEKKKQIKHNDLTAINSYI